MWLSAPAINSRGAASWSTTLPQWVGVVAFAILLRSSESQRPGSFQARAEAFESPRHAAALPEAKLVGNRATLEGSPAGRTGGLSGHSWTGVAVTRVHLHKRRQHLRYKNTVLACQVEETLSSQNQSGRRYGLGHCYVMLRSAPYMIRPSFLATPCDAKLSHEVLYKGVRPSSRTAAAHPALDNRCCIAFSTECL